MSDYGDIDLRLADSRYSDDWYREAERHTEILSAFFREYALHAHREAESSE